MAASTFHDPPMTEGLERLTDKYPLGGPVLSLDGEDFRTLFRAGCAWLEQDHQVVNALNVFPVPDGDTGTNMLLTMQSALEEIESLQTNNAGEVVKAAAHGALMGARGNSGVILSQIFRGLARRLENETLVDATELVDAFQIGSDTAYRGVVRPVEGTILTVIREVAEALHSRSSNNDLRAVFGVIVRTAAAAVEKTPTLLPVLAEAGVVDAGGQGLFLILEGMHRCLQGIEVFVTPAVAVELIEHAAVLEGEYGYDVQCVVLGTGLDVEQMRHDIAQMGDSVLVVGDSRTVKVHVHTDEPGTPLNYCAALGQIDRIIVENMQMQYERFLGEGGPRAEGVAMATSRPPAALVASVSLGPIGTVAVTVGEGLESVFRSLGVHAIVPGGQTMNPSTEDLLKAIEQVATDEVIVLPNNKNIILAAQQAQQLSSKTVRVVLSKSIPQGISALLVLNQQADLETNVRMMGAALSNVQTGEVTVAVRDVNLGDIRVTAGDFIGLRDDDLTVRGDSPEAVVFALLEQMAAEDAEIITLYRGEPTPTADAEALVVALQDRYPEQEIELVDGGQPHYHYIFSVE